MQKMDQSTLEAIQSLDKFQSENLIQQEEQQKEKESTQIPDLQISDPIDTPQSINRPILEKTPAQIKAELESLENKLNSIKNLQSFVDKKFKNGKLSEDKYKKQVAKLEKDKKKTIEKIQRLHEKME
jgi:chromosome segregation ATPase